MRYSYSSIAPNAETKNDDGAYPVFRTIPRSFIHHPGLLEPGRARTQATLSLGLREDLFGGVLYHTNLTEDRLMFRR